VEHASDLNRRERTRTAFNCIAATCVESVFQVGALGESDWQILGRVQHVIVDQTAELRKF